MVFVLNSGIRRAFFAGCLCAVVILGGGAFSWAFSPLDRESITRFLLFGGGPIVSAEFSRAFFARRIFSVFPVKFPMRASGLCRGPVSLSIRPLRLPGTASLVLLSRATSGKVRGSAKSGPDWESRVLRAGGFPSCIPSIIFSRRASEPLRFRRCEVPSRRVWSRGACLT